KAFAGPDDIICENSTYQLSGANAIAYTGLLWTTSGSGSFDDPAILNPVYTPGANDIAIGFVNLTLTVYANLPCEAQSDIMTLVITRKPTADAGPDAIICEGSSYTLSGTSAANYSSLLWITSGTGTLTNETSLIPTYTPGTGETGDITLTLTANGNEPCSSNDDAMILTILPSAQAYAGPDDTICQYTTFQLSDATASNFLSLEWTTSGTGSFDDASLINPVYTPGLNDFNVGFVTLTLSANGNSLCPSFTDEMRLFISSYPSANAGPDAKICQKTPFPVTGASAANYTSIQWTTTGAGILTDATSLTPSYNPANGETGLVKMIITVQGNTGCGNVLAFDVMELTINETVNANAGADITIPLNTATQLNGSVSGGSGIYQYNWLPADMLTLETTESPQTIPLTENTEFILIVSDRVTGCQDSDTVIVFVTDHQNLPPVAVDDYDTTNFQAPVTINVLYNDFDPENSLLTVSICDSALNGKISVNDDGSILYTPDSGFSGDDQFCYVICDEGLPVLCDSAVVYIHVLLKQDIHVVNGFSPNGDGIYDFLIINGIEAFPDNEIIIYNRYGDKIRALSHYDNHDVIWDGSNSAGEPVPDGTYFYVLKINNQPSLSGWIFIRGKK
ncbi:MAG: gliding motility-associated C-terminal domain-containing protein, partial [Bacteroidales bacterium]